MLYKYKLKNLQIKRKKIVHELFITREQIAQAQEELLTRELQIRVEFEHAVQKATAEESKVKYSNAERRKVELAKLQNADLKLNEIKNSLLGLQQIEQKLICENDMLKIKERYLFKEIELFVTLKNFDAAVIKTKE